MRLACRRRGAARAARARAGAWAAGRARARRARRGTPCRRDASSNAPWRAATAPVNAPFSWPNSSLSISVPATAPQSTTMNGAPLRGDSWCSVRAIMSLPVPVSPSISTVASVGAIRSIRPKISRIAGDLPTISPSCSFSLGRISMRSSNGVNLSSHAPTRDHRAGAQVGLLDLGAVEERAVRALQVADEVALGVARDLEVDARHGLVGEHEIVLGRLADAEHVARDHELGAALGALDHDELAATKVDRGRRRFAPDPRPRQVLHRRNRTAITCVAARHARRLSARDERYRRRIVGCARGTSR